MELWEWLSFVEIIVYQSRDPQIQPAIFTYKSRGQRILQRIAQLPVREADRKSLRELSVMRSINREPCIACIILARLAARIVELAIGSDHRRARHATRRQVCPMRAIENIPHMLPPS